MKTILGMLFFYVLGFNAIAQSTVTIKGKIIGRESKSMFVIPRTTSTRSTDKPIVKIENNEFSYSFTPRNLEAYEIVFEDEYNKGAWRRVIFFPDTSNIEMTLYAMEDADKNIVKGGKLNENYYHYSGEENSRYQKVRDSLSERQRVLEKKDSYRSKEYELWRASLQKAKSQEEKLPLYKQQEEMQKTGRDLTPEGLKIRLSFDSLNNELLKWRYTYIKQNPSINNYYLMFNDVQYQAKQNRYLAMLIDETYKQYALRFPDHFYTKVVGDAIGGIVKVFPGNQFVDFAAPDLDGKIYTLSNEIKGKVAIINLWGSWCGPCIAKTKLVAPIYHRYKNKGFTIVNIAREFKDTQALKSRLKKEKFNWLNLVEMDDKAGIWNKYSVGDGGGVQVLVDASGVILAVDPTAEEVERIVKGLIAS
ncbi:MAG: AhpC/TSA family protein [Pedobacter sp.]|nr:MAG: AhpC/TSA family protein [Pedobacter sp.]